MDHLVVAAPSLEAAGPGAGIRLTADIKTCAGLRTL